MTFHERQQLREIFELALDAARIALDVEDRLRSLSPEQRRLLGGAMGTILSWVKLLAGEEARRTMKETGAIAVEATSSLVEDFLTDKPEG